MYEVKRNDISWPQGTSLKLGFPLFTADQNPANLAGFSARGQVRTITKNELLQDLTPYLSIEGNMVILAIPPLISSAWTWRTTAKYDIELFKPDDATVSIRATMGEFRVNRETTI